MSVVISATTSHSAMPRTRISNVEPSTTAGAMSTATPARTSWATTTELSHVSEIFTCSPSRTVNGGVENVRLCLLFATDTKLHARVYCRVEEVREASPPDRVTRTESGSLRTRGTSGGTLPCSQGS